mmetsp:Transcript_29436/g.67159  ORF Transcript_29436/g.67159 Transcript_29436/m.67159 type:complete len:352 (+) Transcript_29436:1055-2110(+)
MKQGPVELGSGPPPPNTLNYYHIDNLHEHADLGGVGPPAGLDHRGRVAPEQVLPHRLAPHRSGVRSPHRLDPRGGREPHEQIAQGALLPREVLCDPGADHALQPDRRELAPDHPPPRHALDYDDVDDVELVRQLGDVPPPVRLEGHGAVLPHLLLPPDRDAPPPALDGDYARQLVHGHVDRKVHPDHALDDCDRVQVLEDVHRGQVPADDALDLRGAVVVVLEGVPGEPAPEGRLYLDGGPDGDLEVALGLPPADEGLDREHGAHAPDRGLPRQELPRLGLDRYGRGPEEADAGALDGVLDLAEARLDVVVVRVVDDARRLPPPPRVVRPEGPRLARLGGGPLDRARRPPE